MASLSRARQLARGRLFPALTHPDFRRMWFAEISANTSSWALITAKGWLVFRLAESNPSSWVGAVTFMSMIPYVFVPVLAGLLADRFVRKNLLASAYAANVVINLLLTFLVLTDQVQIWHVVLISFATGSATAVQYAAAESLTANLVPRKYLINAYALVNAVFHSTRLLGPGVIAPLIERMDLGWIFLLCAGSYMLALPLALRISTISTGVVEPARSIFYNLFSGFRYTYSHPIICSIILLVLFHCALTMSFESMLPAISDFRLGTGGSGVAYMSMMVGFGALLISLGIAPLRDESLRGRLFLTLGLTSALSPLILAIAPNLFIAMIGTTTMGATQAGFMVLSSTMIQSVVPDAVRGRVTSIYVIHAGGIMSFSMLGYGRMADSIDPGWILTVAGLAFMVVMLGSVLRTTVRRLYLAGVPASVGGASE